MKKSFSQVAVIGGGPAGISCAVQLKRFGIDCLLFEKEKTGGMLWNAGTIDNYPGFPQGISGEEICSRLQQHADRFEVSIIRKEVREVRYLQNEFSLHGEGFEHLCKRLLIASGTKPISLPPVKISPEAKAFIFRDVHPLKKITGKTIGIAGAGDAAFDYALSLTKDNIVFIFNRSKKIKAIESLAEQVKKHQNIRYHENTALKEVSIADDKLLVQTSEGNFSIDFLIFAIGREAAVDFLSDNMLDRKDKLIETGKLFLAGDVVNGTKRQLAIAAGDGLRAAMTIKELEG